MGGGQIALPFPSLSSLPQFVRADFSAFPRKAPLSSALVFFLQRKNRHDQKCHQSDGDGKGGPDATSHTHTPPLVLVSHSVQHLLLLCRHFGVKAAVRNHKYEGEEEEEEEDEESG